MSEEIQNQNESPNQSLSDHDQAMVDKVDQHQEGVEDSLKTDEERMLAGKYKSVEDLEKAYEHLQSKLGKQDEDPAEPTETQETVDTPKEEEAKQIATDNGIDYDALQVEYQDSGELSGDTYKALEASGIPKTMVDAYIAGQEALTQSTITQMYEVAGGETEYNAMLQWAEESLSESEVNAFNSALTDEAQTKFAIQGLHARYNAEKGPNLIRGQANPAVSGGFASKQEMMAEMSNPQYKRDPAFRAVVQRRVALSKF